MRFHRLRRFSLATLLIVVSLCAAGLGIARWQRQQTLDTYRKWSADGVGLILAVDKSRLLAKLGLGKFWLGHPRTAEIYVSRVGADEYKIGPTTMSWAEAEKHLLALRDKLRAFGVTDIQVWSFNNQQSTDVQTLVFAASNGMAGGGMSSQSEIDKRLESLKP